MTARQLTLAVLALSLSASPAFAATGAAPLNVTAGIVVSCDMSGDANSGTPSAQIDFGTHMAGTSAANASQTPSSGTGALQILCNSSSATPTLTISTGTNAGGSSLRRLIGPSATLVDYALFHDSGMAQPVDGNPFALPALTGGTRFVLVVYGKLPVPAQASIDGAYTDTLTLSLAY